MFEYRFRLRTFRFRIVAGADDCCCGPQQFDSPDELQTRRYLAFFVYNAYEINAVVDNEEHFLLNIN